MANTFKALYRGNASTSSSTLYTVPASTTTLVSSIVVANISASGQTYTLNLDGVAIASLVPIPANDSVILEPKQVIETTKTITGFASAENVTFHISGLEIT